MVTTATAGLGGAFARALVVEVHGACVAVAASIRERSEAVAEFPLRERRARMYPTFQRTGH